jgi:hypothetical protein
VPALEALASFLPLSFVVSGLVACGTSQTARDGGALRDGPSAHDALADGGSDAAVDAHTPRDASVDSVTPPRSLGTIKQLTYEAACDSDAGTPVGSTLADGGANKNVRCAMMVVSCPDVVDLTAIVALSAQPEGIAPKGIIVTDKGLNGTVFFGGPLGRAWYDAGFAVAEVAWTTPWECPRGSTATDPTVCIDDTTPIATRRGLIDVACRPATVFSWVRTSARLPDGRPFFFDGKGFCGFGTSAGSGALWYSLLHYGLGAEFDFVGMAASTPYAQIDLGCNPANAGMTIATPCENLATNPEVPLLYDSNGSMHNSLIDDWSSTTSCDKNPTVGELAYWKRTSIDSPGANYDVPTHVTTYDCVNLSDVNAEPGMNAMLFAQLRKVDPTGARFRATCVENGVNGSCLDENSLGDGGLGSAATTDMEKECRPLK